VGVSGLVGAGDLASAAFSPDGADGAAFRLDPDLPPSLSGSTTIFTAEPTGHDRVRLRALKRRAGGDRLTAMGVKSRRAGSLR